MVGKAETRRERWGGVPCGRSQRYFTRPCEGTESHVYMHMKWACRYLGQCVSLQIQFNTDPSQQKSEQSPHQYLEKDSASALTHHFIGRKQGCSSEV